MRIIGGLYRSRIILMPKSVDIRPTQDKVRQAVFNILADINGRRVLDLFAGSGAFGLEALSRGAGPTTFVDSQAGCARTIKINIETLGISPGLYEIIRHNALSLLQGLQREGRAYDLVFMDPPYGKDLAKICLINLDLCDILSRNAFVVVESSRSDELPEGLKTLAKLTERRYGNTVITIYRKTA